MAFQFIQASNGTLLPVIRPTDTPEKHQRREIRPFPLLLACQKQAKASTGLEGSLLTTDSSINVIFGPLKAPRASAARHFDHHVIENH